MLSAEIALIMLGGRLYGLTGAAFGLLIAGMLPFPFVAVALSRLLELRRTDWLTICGRPMMSTVAMVGILIAWDTALGRFLREWPSIFVLLGSILLDVAVYVASSFVLWRIAGSPKGPEYYVKERIENWLARRSA